MKNVSKKYPQIEQYTLKSGQIKYRFTIYLGVDPNTEKDKIVTRSSFTSIKEAELTIDKLKYEFQLGMQPESSRKTFKEVYLEWDENYKNSGIKMSTYSKTTGYFENHILPFFGDMKVAKINVRHCEEFARELSNNLKHFHHVINYAKDVLDTAIRYSYIQSNPFDKVKKLPKEKKHVKLDNYLEAYELVTLLEGAATKSLEAYALIRLLALSGIRKGELRILTWSDINFEQKTLSINGSYSYSKHNNNDNISTTKTSEDRRILLDDKTLDILKDWKKEQVQRLHMLNITRYEDDNQLIFANTKNNIIKDYYPNKILIDVLTKTKLRHITIHGLRHTHATHLAEAGAAFVGIQQRLGHSISKNTTAEVYIHVTDTIKQRTLDEYIAYLNSKGIH